MLSSSALAHSMYQQEASWLTESLSEMRFEEVGCNWQGEKKGQEMRKDKQKSWDAHSLHASTCTILNTWLCAEDTILDKSLDCCAHS